MDLHDLQLLYKKHLGEANHPKLASFIALVEEVGEVAQEILNKEIYDKPNCQIPLEDEVADIMISLLEICDVYNIDLEKAFLRKFEIIKNKAEYEWPDSLTPILKEKRNKLDR